MLRIVPYTIQNLKKKTPIITRINENGGSIIDHLKTPTQEKFAIEGYDSPISDHEILKIDIFKKNFIRSETKKKVDIIIPNTLKKLVQENINDVNDFDELVIVLTDAKKESIIEKNR